MALIAQHLQAVYFYEKPLNEVACRFAVESPAWDDVINAYLVSPEPATA